MIGKLKFQLRALFHKNLLESELDEELRFHLEKEIEQNIALGMTRKQARRAAYRDFGGVERFKEESRDTRGTRLIEDLWQDLRYGFRMLRKTPVFTVTAVLSLALGIGANAALFSVVDAVFLKTLPVKDPERLVLFEWQAPLVFRTSGLTGYGTDSWPAGMTGSSSFQSIFYERFRKQPSVLSDLFSFAELANVTLQTNGHASKESAQVISGNYFGGLGLQTILGRAITPDDDQPAAPPVTVISFQCWQDRFAGDREIVGKQITLNGVQFTIVGVTPSAFSSTLQVDSHPNFSIPLAQEPAVYGGDSVKDQPNQPGPWWIHLMGRLKPGATIEQAREDFSSTFQQTALEILPAPQRDNEAAVLLPNQYPTLLALAGSRGMVESRQEYSFTIYFLLGVVGLVLLIACANVANLLLARSVERGREITLRLAVGARRWRIVRQLLTESVMLSVLSGAVGVLFAVLGRDALVTMSGANGSVLPEGVNYRIDWRVLAFAFGISLLTGLLFGLAPALRGTKFDLVSALKSGGRGSIGASRTGASKTLVVVQVSASLVLLVGAGLFVRTLRNLEKVDLGFNQENLLLFNLQPNSNDYSSERIAQLYQNVFLRLDSLPGVRSATFAWVPLIGDQMRSSSVFLPDEKISSDKNHRTNREVVRSNFFDTLKIPVLRGRGFTEHDNKSSPKAAIISETFARQFFPNQDPVGQFVRFGRGSSSPMEIVGVARDIKYASQRDDDFPLIYTPWLQEIDHIGQMYFSIRYSGELSSMTTAVRDTIRQVDDTIPISSFKTQMVQSSQALTNERVFARLVGFFALLVLLLATIGLYGILANSVAQRTNEIGIRMALGASKSHVLQLVISQGLRLAVIGLAIGTFAAFLLTTIIKRKLFGISATDPLTYIVTGLILLMVAIFACWIPARRAASVDPMEALRSE